MLKSIFKIVGVLSVAAIFCVGCGDKGDEGPDDDEGGGTKSSYTITFDPTGGTVSPTSGKTGADGKLASLPTPTRSDYTFNGWFTAATGGTAVTASTVFTTNTTIYAQWTAVPVNPPATLNNIEMVSVTGGTFTMGCTQEQGNDCYDAENPAHQVTVDNFSIGKYEVTQGLWKAVMGSLPSSISNSYGMGDNYPVYYVSWNDIQTFITTLNNMTGKKYRLPTEAEWEFAARGGNSGKNQNYKYSGSDNIDEVAWYSVNSGSKTHPVGEKAPNELGLYDMSGNVYEWVNDWYGSYSGSAVSNPTGPNTGSHRVGRGGSWYNDAWFCRVSFRPNRPDGGPAYRAIILGFRLGLSP
jgi:uncharacterized repeat protein (TIGR02543 family)